MTTHDLVKTTNYFYPFRKGNNRNKKITQSKERTRGEGSDVVDVGDRKVRVTGPTAQF